MEQGRDETTQDVKRARTDQAAPEAMAVDTTTDGTEQHAKAVGPSMRSLMVQYYKQLFPVQQMFRWLCYGNDGTHAAADGSFSSRRELCFTLDGDIFVRYQSYKVWSDLHSDLVRKVPSKIDIGPVYTHDPRQRAKYAKDFKPVERELVIDIDMTDYDEVRTCGSGGHICTKCWPFMAVAIQVLDTALREDFGFKHILWVYSGRRGVHCWVADESARQLADDVRGAVVSYLSVLKGTEGGMAKLGMGISKHPALERAEQMINTAWLESILPQQELLSGPDQYQAVLRYVPDDEIVSRMSDRWAKGGQGVVPGGAGGGRRNSSVMTAEHWGSLSVCRWYELEKAVLDKAAGLKGFDKPKLEKCLTDIKFAYSYPRLDVEVTKKMNHLLKAPFCVHPKTGKVCVPIDPGAAWEFDPDQVPTVQQLVSEVQQKQQQQQQTDSGQQQQQQQQVDGWSGTALEPYIKSFTSSFLAPLTSSNRTALNNKAKQAAADQRVHRVNVSW